MADVVNLKMIADIKKKLDYITSKGYNMKEIRKFAGYAMEFKKLPDEAIEWRCQMFEDIYKGVLDPNVTTDKDLKIYMDRLCKVYTVDYFYGKK